MSRFLPEPELEQLSKLLPPPSHDPEKMDTDQDPEDYLEVYREPTVLFTCTEGVWQ